MPPSVLSPAGFVCHAPILAQWFRLVDRLKFTSKLRAIVSKVILDQTLWGPFSVRVPAAPVRCCCAPADDDDDCARALSNQLTMFFSMMSLMEGSSVHEAVERVQVGFLPTYIRGAFVFMPTAALTYSVIPLAHRGLFLQAVGLGWNTYLSIAGSKASAQVAEIEAEHAAAGVHPTLLPKSIPTAVLPQSARPQ